MNKKEDGVPMWKFIILIGCIMLTVAFGNTWLGLNTGTLVTMLYAGWVLCGIEGLKDYIKSPFGKLTLIAYFIWLPFEILRLCGVISLYMRII